MNEIAETSSLKFAGARMTMLYSGRGGGGTDEPRAAPPAPPLAVTSPEGDTTASWRLPPPLPPRLWPPALDESRDDRDCPHGNSSGSGLLAADSAGSGADGVRIPAWHDAERCCCLFDSRLDRADRDEDFCREVEEEEDECEEPALPRLSSKRCCCCWC